MCIRFRGYLSESLAWSLGEVGESSSSLDVRETDGCLVTTMQVTCKGREEKQKEDRKRLNPQILKVP